MAPSLCGFSDGWGGHHKQGSPQNAPVRMQAGIIMLVISVASWFIISRVWVIILISHLLNRYSRHLALFCSAIYHNSQYNMKWLPQTSCQIPPTSGFSNWWFKGDPHVAYRHWMLRPFSYLPLPVLLSAGPRYLLRDTGCSDSYAPWVIQG